MWAEKSVFYQIYPLGFCGAPEENDGILAHRLSKVGQWAEHIQKLGAEDLSQPRDPGHSGRGVQPCGPGGLGLPGRAGETVGLPL